MVQNKSIETPTCVWTKTALKFRPELKSVFFELVDESVNINTFFIISTVVFFEHFDERNFQNRSPQKKTKRKKTNHARETVERDHDERCSRKQNRDECWKEKDEKEDLALFVRIVFAAGVLSRRSAQREEYHFNDDDGEKQQPWF